MHAAKATGEQSYGHWHLPGDQLQQLIDALRQTGRRVLGPVLKDAAITIQEIDSVDDLPRGVRTTQTAGRYRISQADQPHLFAFQHGADSWKSQLFPARRLLVELDRNLIATSRPASTQTPAAFLGVRACDLAAIQNQARVFANADPGYETQLASSFLVGVHCQSAASTCFCPSAGSGPEFASAQYLDLLLTEIVDEAAHFFIVAAYSRRGADLIEALKLDTATDAQIQQIEVQLDNTRKQIETHLPADSRTLLRDLPNAEQWDDVANRCLACGNCTMVCPTCFCSDVEEHTDLAAQTAQRWQVWDSCFNHGHSAIHAGPVRASTRARYRQWLTHKLSTWYDQFGTSGCTGCGRCITWCPVGIDLTAEVAAIAAEAKHEH